MDLNFCNAKAGRCLNAYSAFFFKEKHQKTHVFKIFFYYIKDIKGTSLGPVLPSITGLALGL